MVHKVYFPDAFLALQKEVQQHPQLMEQLKNCVDWEDQLGTIAAYLNILLDGVYEQVDLMDMLVMQLKKKGTIYLDLHSAPAKDHPRLVSVLMRETKDKIEITEVPRVGSPLKPRS